MNGSRLKLRHLEAPILPKPKLKLITAKNYSALRENKTSKASNTVQTYLNYARVKRTPICILRVLGTS